MDIRMVWCKRQTKCRHCEEVIEVATPMVMGKLYKGVKRRLTITMYWHPQCWIDTELAYLDDNPYTPGIRGRKRLSLPLDEQRKRFLLIRRYNTLKSRKDKLPSGNPDDILRIISMEEKMAQIAKEMEEIGGIPQKWLIKV